jgi:hypothetical protein
MLLPLASALLLTLLLAILLLPVGVLWFPAAVMVFYVAGVPALTVVPSTSVSTRSGVFAVVCIH